MKAPHPRPVPSGPPRPTQAEIAIFNQHLMAVWASWWRNLPPAERAALERPTGAGAGR